MQSAAAQYPASALAASMLGEFGGSVLNDATEAGIRQSRNNQARPILIDEFEPDQSVRNGSKQDGKTDRGL